MAHTRMSTETLVVLVAEQCDVDHGNDQVSADCKARKVDVFEILSDKGRICQSCQPSFLFSFYEIGEGLTKLKREQIAKTINYFKCKSFTFSWVVSFIPIYQIIFQNLTKEV